MRRLFWPILWHISEPKNKRKQKHSNRDSPPGVRVLSFHLTLPAGLTEGLVVFKHFLISQCSPALSKPPFPIFLDAVSFPKIRKQQTLFFLPTFLPWILTPPSWVSQTQWCPVFRIAAVPHMVIDALHSANINIKGIGDSFLLWTAAHY